MNFSNLLCSSIRRLGDLGNFPASGIGPLRKSTIILLQHNGAQWGLNGVQWGPIGSNGVHWVLGGHADPPRPLGCTWGNYRNPQTLWMSVGKLPPPHTAPNMSALGLLVVTHPIPALPFHVTAFSFSGMMPFTGRSDLMQWRSQ